MERSLINEMSSEKATELCSDSYVVKLVQPLFRQDTKGRNHVGSKLLSIGKVDNRWHTYWDSTVVPSGSTTSWIEKFWMNKQKQTFLPGSWACNDGRHTNYVPFFSTLMQTSNWFFESWIKENSVPESELTRISKLREDFGLMVLQHSEADRNDFIEFPKVDSPTPDKKKKAQPVKIAGVVSFAALSPDNYFDKETKHALLPVIYQNPDGSYVVWGVTSPDAQFSFQNELGDPITIDVQTSYKYFTSQPLLPKEKEDMKLTVNKVSFGAEAGFCNLLFAKKNLEYFSLSGENSNVRAYGLETNLNRKEIQESILGRLPTIYLGTAKEPVILPHNSQFLILPEDLEDLDESWLTKSDDPFWLFPHNEKLTRRVRIIHRAAPGGKQPSWQTVREFPPCNHLVAHSIIKTLFCWKDNPKKGGKPIPSFSYQYNTFVKFAIVGPSGGTVLYPLTQLVTDLFNGRKVDTNKYFWRFFKGYVSSHRIDDQKNAAANAFRILEQLNSLNQIER